MEDVKTLIEKIDELPVDKQLEIYAHMRERLWTRERVMGILEKIRGRGSWGMDAQEYVNQLRDDDRI